MTQEKKGCHSAEIQNHSWLCHSIFRYSQECDWKTHSVLSYPQTLNKLVKFPVIPFLVLFKQGTWITSTCVLHGMQLISVLIGHSQSSTLPCCMDAVRGHRPCKSILKSFWLTHCCISWSPASITISKKKLSHNYVSLDSLTRWKADHTAPHSAAEEQ